MDQKAGEQTMSEQRKTRSSVAAPERAEETGSASRADTTSENYCNPLMAGLVCGAYSSICIATELWYVMKVHLGKNKATK